MKLHFAGVGGSGMSALAQFHCMTGGEASGSDRAFDQAARGDGGEGTSGTIRGAGAPGGATEIRRRLEEVGLRIYPQDGSGPAAGCDALVVSTAVEETVPDVRAARERGIPILHRSELLARFVRERESVAVTGTSGKSTVTAMIFEILRGSGRDPSVITGGDLLCLQEQGLLGNAWAGGGPLLVIEADESDGSLVRYEPWAGVLLNLQRDHKEPEELLEIFRVFRRNTRGPFLMGEETNLLAVLAGESALPAPAGRSPAVRFGLSAGCDFRAEEIEPTPAGSAFTVRGTGFRLPCPGLHNVANAIAAVAACSLAGVPLEEMVAPLQRFQGVARRFQVLGSVKTETAAGLSGKGTTAGPRGAAGTSIEVIDDFAHNPAKIAAALATAAPRGTRVLAVYQPHGYGPTRFLRDGLIEAFVRGLRPEGRLYMPEIFYAGGTAVRDISSREIVEAVSGRGIPAQFRPRREDLLPLIAAEARGGDVVLVMGARDPSLPQFCRQLLDALRSRQERTGRPSGEDG